jgi:hypothetical protein
MKKIALLFVVIGAVSFASCKKCTTCYYKFKTGGTYDVYMYPEECGAKKDLEDFKNKCKEQAATRNTVCVCTDGTGKAEESAED